MKACLLLALLSLIAFSHGAVVPVPGVSGHPAISQGETKPTLEKAGRAFENLGKILQGETGSMSREELQSVIASNLSDLEDIDGEYVLGWIIKKIGGAVKAIGNAVSEALN